MGNINAFSTVKRAVLTVVLVLLCIVAKGFGIEEPTWPHIDPTPEPTHTHTWINATCTAPKTCSVCGATEGVALGHTDSDFIVDMEPTVGHEGRRHKECTVCGAVLLTESIDALTLELSFSHESGFYSDAFELTITPSVDATVYYTLDSSAPDKTSCVYSEPLLIEDNSSSPNVYSAIDGISSLEVFTPTSPVDKCVVVRAYAVTEDGYVSDTVCKSYFVGYDEKSGYGDLPVVSLVVDPEDLFDYETGIYVTGKIYDESEHSGYPETFPANYNQTGKEWERPAQFTYFNGDKSYLFEQEIGVRIHGGWSRAFNQKSFNLYARKEYSGTKTFAYSFFETKKMQTCMLRSGGYRDTYITKVRDSLNQDFAEDLGFSVQNGFPCILFLNGEYWGVYNLQERFTEYYVQEHYGVDKDNVIIIENDEVDEGQDSDIAYYEELIAFFRDNHFEDAEAYAKVDKYIDVQEFAAYMATELYVGNIDWPGNNVRMWRARETSDKPYEDGVWHFMMYDTDDSSNILPSKCSVSSDPFKNINHWKSGPLDENCVLGLMLSRLLENQSFVELFTETYTRIGSEVFAPDLVAAYLQEKEELLREPMALFYTRFVSENTAVYNQDYFSKKMDDIEEFFADRYAYAYNALYENVIAD